MSWPSGGADGRGTPAPVEDGLSLSTHAQGAIGRAWLAQLDEARADTRDRVLRGKNYARRGRVRAVEVAPGGASGEVVVDLTAHPSVRIRPFTRAEWSTVVEVLRCELTLIASLLEGELPDALIGRLRQQGVQILPTPADIGFDCDCGDYLMPCAHVSALYHLLGDVVDGDPFQLLTLRGRGREELLATLLATWGDDVALRGPAPGEEDAPVDARWLAARGPIPDFPCSLQGGAVTAAGVRALGPCPGGIDLVATLEPLYAAGAQAAQAVMERAGELPPRGPRAARARVDVPPPPPVEEASTAPPVEPTGGGGEETMADPGSRSVEADAGPTAANRPPEPGEGAADGDATERIVDVLAEHDGVGSTELAAHLGMSLSRVRAELLALEKLGLVVRQQRGGVLTWHVG